MAKGKRQLQRFSEDDFVISVRPEIADARFFFITVLSVELARERKVIASRRVYNQDALPFVPQAQLGSSNQSSANPIPLKFRMYRECEHVPRAIGKIFRNDVTKANGFAAMTTGKPKGLCFTGECGGEHVRKHIAREKPRSVQHVLKRGNIID